MALINPSGLSLMGGTLRGALRFSGTLHPGLIVLSLTTAQRDALTPELGMVIFNVTTGDFEGYDGVWGGLGGGGGVSLPVADTTAIVSGSADATKLLRFEVDGFTAGVTRVLTPPNADGTIAVLGLAQTWTAAQTMSAVITANAMVRASGFTTPASGSGLEIGTTGGNGVIQAYNRTGSAFIPLHITASLIGISPTVGVNIGGTATVVDKLAVTSGASTRFSVGKTDNSDTNGRFLIVWDGVSSTGSINAFAAGSYRQFKIDGGPVLLNTSSAFGVGVGTGLATPLGKLHVDQSSASGAQPVLYLDQADESEEILEIVSTAGVGNAIELVGAKTLTVTEFMKITVNGATRYVPIGTIA